MAQIATALEGELPVTFEITVSGEVSEHDCSILATSALKGALLATGMEDVTYVNSPNLAAEKGLTSTVVTEAECEDYRSMISLRAAFSNGNRVEVDATLMGIRKVEKIVRINKFDIELPPTDHLLFLIYEDKPGVVGAVGNILGASKINIANMQVARDKAGGEALMALTVDSAIPSDVAAKIAEGIGARVARSVSLQS
jgi:D-3-phosphoglycerate dehydrogenase